MANSYRKSRVKKKEQVEYLKDELSKNRDTYRKNEEGIKLKGKLLEALRKDFVFEKAKYELNKKTNKISGELLDVELANCGVVNPLMSFHSSPDWIVKWKELKDNEKDALNMQGESLDRDWELFQQEQKQRREKISERWDDSKIAEQQGRIDKRNPEIIKELKGLGVDVVKEELEDKSYIG